MVETFFKRSCIILRLRQGPLAGHIDLLAARLAATVFLEFTAESRSAWSAISTAGLIKRVSVHRKIDEALIERYWRYFQRRKRVRWKLPLPPDVGEAFGIVDPMPHAA